MDENKTNVELEEKSVETTEEDVSKMDNDALKSAIEEQMRKLRTQSLLLGAQSICQVILQKIYEVQQKPGKKTYRDYERLIKDIQQFCKVGISRKVNLDGTTSEKDDAETDTEQTEE